jgi:hypothetical protein
LFVPADGEVGVDRDVAVRAELSELIDSETVTAESVTLTGPDGEVTGSVSVDGGTITLVPEEPLHILGRYTFTIHNTVKDLAGNGLEQNASAAFEARDGRWSAPTRPFGEMVPYSVTEFQRNAFGDVVLGVETWPSRTTVYGAIYQQSVRRWSMLLQLIPLPGTYLGISGAGIDSARRAAWTWSGGGDSGWSRARDVAFAEKVGGIGAIARVAVTPDGKATAIWDLEGIVSQTQDQSDGTVELSVPISQDISFVAPVVSLERTGYFGVRLLEGREELLFAWKTDSAWEEPAVLGSAAQIYPFDFDSDESGNIIVVWCQVGEIWARVYERENDAWTEPLYLSEVPPGAVVGRPDMSAGNAIVTFNTFDPDPSTWAAIYRRGIGLVQSSVIRLDEPYSGGQVAATIDSQGNALAAWHPSLRFRRFTQRAGWSETSSLGESVNQYYMWAAAAPDGTATLVTNELGAAGEGNLAPLVVHFD